MRFGKLLGGVHLGRECKIFGAPSARATACSVVARSGARRAFYCSAASHNSHALDDTTAGTKTDADLNVLRCSLQRPKGYFFPRLRREKIRENVLKIVIFWSKNRI